MRLKREAERHQQAYQSRDKEHYFLPESLEMRACACCGELTFLNKSKVVVIDDAWDRLMRDRLPWTEDIPQGLRMITIYQSKPGQLGTSSVVCPCRSAELCRFLLGHHVCGSACLVSAPSTTIDADFLHAKRLQMAGRLANFRSSSSTQPGRNGDW